MIRRHSLLTLSKSAAARSAMSTTVRDLPVAVKRTRRTPPNARE